MRNTAGKNLKNFPAGLVIFPFFHQQILGTWFPFPTLVAPLHRVATSVTINFGLIQCAIICVSEEYDHMVFEKVCGD